MDTPLTHSDVARNPGSFAGRLESADGEAIVFRPLEPSDAEALASFLHRLTPETRRLSVFDGYDLETARALCDAINRYDKLRLVLETADGQRIIGLMELSFGISQGDIDRYEKAGIHLDTATDCRYGPTLADDYQCKGLGSKALPMMIQIARCFGKRRIILWGGVFADNARAIHFYRKNGFVLVGAFTNKDGEECLDMLIEIHRPADSDPRAGD